MISFQSFRQLLIGDRSIRRFEENKKINYETLLQLVELTRYCSSGRNLQPLKYKIIFKEEECEKVFPLLAWAGYLTDWPGPEVGERPSAYLVQCLDTSLTDNCLCDDGLQLQAITLGAASLGIGGCVIKAFNAPKLKETLQLAPHLLPLYVLALGYPKEKVVIEDLQNDVEDSYKYFRTSDKIHHVPKRRLEDLILE